MRKLSARSKSPLPVRILTVLLFVMIVVFIGCMSYMISELRHAYSRDYYSGINYYLDDGNYGGMIQYYYNQHYDVDPFPGAHSEYYQIAAYSNAAFLHQYYQASENTQATAFWSDRMESAREQCGELSVVTDDIDQLLEQIPIS